MDAGLWRLDADINKKEVQEFVDVIKAGNAPGLDGVATKYLDWDQVTIVKWQVKLLNLFCVGYSVEWVVQCFHCSAV